MPWGCCSSGGMCWEQQEPGFTLLSITAQHSCGILRDSSPHPSPAPASSPSPGGDKAPKPGAPKPGAQNPAAYAGKGLLQQGGVVLAQGWGFLCDVSSLRALGVGAGGGEGPSRSCLLFPSGLSWRRFPQEIEAGKDQTDALCIGILTPERVRFFSLDPFFLFNPLGSAGGVNVSCF